MNHAPANRWHGGLPECRCARDQFIDGTIVEVRPTDLSGAAGVEFWNVAVFLDLETPPDPDGQLAFVDTVTAYDASGRPIAHDTGLGPVAITP